MIYFADITPAMSGNNKKKRPFWDRNILQFYRVHNWWNCLLIKLLHCTCFAEQDRGLEVLSEAIQRQKLIGNVISDEVDLHNGKMTKSFFGSSIEGKNFHAHLAWHTHILISFLPQN